VTGVDLVELYTDTRTRLVTLAATLDTEAAETAVAATPGWSVKDVYAHLTGVAADLVSARRDGMGSPEWTARQVGERRTDDLAAVCAEWTELEPRFIAWAGEQESPPVFAGLDIWTHQQDLRTTLGLPVDADARSAFLVGAALQAFDGRFRREGIPAVRLVTDDADAVVGDGAPVATLRTDDAELLRLLFSRRTLAQMAAAPWDGDPSPVLDHLHLFPLPEGPLPG
jgi:uncharacterized protein (TIGR03083 family)